MVTAQIIQNDWWAKNPNPIKVDGLVNRGAWFGKTLLIEIANGYSVLNLVVEADNHEDAIDAIVDHPKWSKWLVIDPADFKDDYHTYAGNHGLPIDPYQILDISPCKVNYFAKAEK